MALDDSLVKAEGKAIAGVKTVFVDVYGGQSNRGKLILVLAVLIIGVLGIWFIGKGVVGFASTPMGLAMIGLSIVAIIFYFWMRSQGVGFKSWTGGASEVALIIMVLIVYIGILDEATEIFLTILPILILGGVGWFGYKWYKAQDSRENRNGILVIVLAIIILFPVYEAYVVPMNVGTPHEIIVEVSRGDDGSWNSYAELRGFTLLKMMSTQMNPYGAVISESSHWMWLDVNTVQEVTVDTIIERNVPQETIFTDTNHRMYVSAGDTEKLWGIVHMPILSYEHYVIYDITVIVKDLGGNVLTSYHSTYETE